MEPIQIDWIVVFLAAVVNMLIGFVWYSRWLFGPLCTDVKIPKKMSKAILQGVYGLLVSLVIAFFFSFFEAFLGVTNVTDGMFVGVCFWLGFVATTQISSVIWEGKPISMFFLHSGCKLLSFIVIGGLLGA